VLYKLYLGRFLLRLFQRGAVLRAGVPVAFQADGRGFTGTGGARWRKSGGQ
jgi:hypothetical protein